MDEMKQPKVAKTQSTFSMSCGVAVNIRAKAYIMPISYGVC